MKKNDGDLKPIIMPSKQNSLDKTNVVRNPLSDKYEARDTNRLGSIPEDDSIVEINDYKTPRKELPLTASNIDSLNKKHSAKSSNSKGSELDQSHDQDVWGDTSSISDNRSNYQDGKSLMTMNTTGSKKSKSKQRKDLVPAEKAGFLFKPQKTIGLFTKRYYILRKGTLYSYASEEDSVSNKPSKTPREIFLKGFNLIPNREKTQFLLESGSSEKYILDVKSKFLYDSWHQKLIEHVAYANGYYHLVIENKDLQNNEGVQEIVIPN